MDTFNIVAVKDSLQGYSVVLHITSKFNPVGKMPFTTPISGKAVENNREDVPGYMEGEGYALFKYDEGMSC